MYYRRGEEEKCDRQLSNRSFTSTARSVCSIASCSRHLSNRDSVVISPQLCLDFVLPVLSLSLYLSFIAPLSLSLFPLFLSGLALCQLNESESVFSRHDASGTNQWGS